MNTQDVESAISTITVESQKLYMGLTSLSKSMNGIFNVFSTRGQLSVEQLESMRTDCTLALLRIDNQRHELETNVGLVISSLTAGKGDQAMIYAKNVDTATGRIKQAMELVQRMLQSLDMVYRLNDEVEVSEETLGVFKRVLH